MQHWWIVEVDPQGNDARALLREAAIEARLLYPDLFAPDAPWPDNPPTPRGGAYLVAFRPAVGGEPGAPLACAAIRPLGADTSGVAELRRMFVTRPMRRQGLARALLQALQARALALGYRLLRLETGCRQQPAMALYAACGFQRIAPFGDHVGDPTSVCFEKQLPAP